MRVLLLIMILRLAALAAPPFDWPYEGPSGKYSARFSETQGSAHNSASTTLKIKDHAGKVIFSDRILDRVALGARWTEDGKFLVIPTTSGGGRSPWHVHIYIFSIAHRAVRWLDDSNGPPIVTRLRMIPISTPRSQTPFWNALAEGNSVAHGGGVCG